MIRSELDVLLDRIEDPALRADLRTQIDRLKQRRSFGLVFEQHIPERVRLPQHPIRIGSHVVSRDDPDSPTFEVLAIEDGLATVELVRDADGAYVPRGEHPVGERERLAADSLVVITDFGEPVLPGFRFLGSVERGGDKPYHVVINGENHHALEALRFTHAGKVDCIYIDPPYNSGARDWKYNNDYVDDTDAYRHSKWLAFMERRLKLAKELLNPDDSVLIVTIDEKEVHRLGLLIEQTFPHDIQMITSVINPKGSARSGRFSRVDEYLNIVMVGNARVRPWASDMLRPLSASGRQVRWAGLMRQGEGSRRTRIPTMFFAIYIDADSGGFHSVGQPPPREMDRAEVVGPPGTVALWPVDGAGNELMWRLNPASVLEYVEAGQLKFGRRDPQTGVRPVLYLQQGILDQIGLGNVRVLGRDEEGALILEFADSMGTRQPASTWNMTSHSASEHGATVLKALIPARRFPYPKSLYAVEDTIRFFVKDKPHAAVLDFFAGSGTTTHAVARLNQQDGGRRQSIMVTNNEVSSDEAMGLHAKGVRPGDPEWEALGIFEHITRPRVVAAITGRTPDEKPVKGDYKFTDEYPMADGLKENAAFLELRYLDADDVDLGLAYEDIASLLWLRAGAQGPIASRVDAGGSPVPYVWTERYGVLFDEDRWRAFVSARPEGAHAAFIVTNSPTTFAGIVAELPSHLDTVRLYDTYLSMFLPERGRA